MDYNDLSVVDDEVSQPRRYDAIVVASMRSFIPT